MTLTTCMRRSAGGSRGCCVAALSLRNAFTIVVAPVAVVAYAACMFSAVVTWLGARVFAAVFVPAFVLLALFWK